MLVFFFLVFFPLHHQQTPPLTTSANHIIVDLITVDHVDVTCYQTRCSLNHQYDLHLSLPSQSLHLFLLRLVVICHTNATLAIVIFEYELLLFLRSPSLSMNFCSFGAIHLYSSVLHVFLLLRQDHRLSFGVSNSFSAGSGYLVDMSRWRL